MEPSGIQEIFKIPLLAQRLQEFSGSAHRHLSKLGDRVVGSVNDFAQETKVAMSSNDLPFVIVPFQQHKIRMSGGRCKTTDT